MQRRAYNVVQELLDYGLLLVVSQIVCGILPLFGCYVFIYCTTVLLTAFLFNRLLIICCRFSISARQCAIIVQHRLSCLYQYFSERIRLHHEVEWVLRGEHGRFGTCYRQNHIGVWESGSVHAVDHQQLSGAISWHLYKGIPSSATILAHSISAIPKTHHVNLDIAVQKASFRSL